MSGRRIGTGDRFDPVEVGFHPRNTPEVRRALTEALLPVLQQRLDVDDLDAETVHAVELDADGYLTVEFE